MLFGSGEWWESGYFTNLQSSAFSTLKKRSYVLSGISICKLQRQNGEMDSLEPMFLVLISFPTQGLLYLRMVANFLYSWGLVLSSWSSWFYLQNIGLRETHHTPSFCRVQDGTQDLLHARVLLYQWSHILSLGPEISKWSFFSPGSRSFASLPLAYWFQAINSTNPCRSGDLLLMTWRMAESKNWLWVYGGISRERSWFSIPAMSHMRRPAMLPFLFFLAPRPAWTHPWFLKSWVN